MAQYTKQVYLNKVIAQVPRLLAQLDRNPYSKTYGCFDWNYWHDKVSGFPNGHAQESMLVLALLYSIDDSENPYYNHPKIREWALSALRYWAAIQHRDGTVDEFYVNERQLGASAITLYAAARTYLIFGSQVGDDSREMIIKAIRRASKTLSSHDETYVLSNHQSQVLLALYYSGKILHVSFGKAISKRVKRILDNQSEDGWFREYTGADLGYLTTTISFLAEYYEHSKDGRLKDPLKRAMSFASYFIYPDGFFGGVVGSRNTAHLWTAGFETMNRMHPADFAFASVFCDFALESMSKGRLLTPDKEDRYFSEQMYDYLNAYMNYRRDFSKHKGVLLPFQGKDFSRLFDDSGMFISKSEGRYLVINARKGGIFRIYDVKKNRLLSCESGYVGRLRSRKVVTTNCSSASFTLKDRTLQVSADFCYASGAGQSVIKSAGLNILMFFFGRSVSISNFIKDFLIRLLITGKGQAGIHLDRVIDTRSGEIKDSIRITDGSSFDSLSVLSDCKSIFVAYSKYFDLSELDSADVSIGQRMLAQLNANKVIEIKRKIW